jgi:Zn-dependent protease
MILIALAGPATNLAMALIWFAVLEAAARISGNLTLITWIEYMCQAGMLVNVVLAVFNMLPIPPLDGGRVLAGLLPQRWGSQLGKIEPFGLFVGLGFSALRWLDWLFDPALRILGRLIVSVGARA